MARQPASPIDRIIDYFMTAPVAECQIALRTSQRIVNARNLRQAQEPPVNATAKPRRARRKKVDGAATPAASAAPAPTGPTAVVPRRRRGRPPVDKVAQHTVPTALPVDAQGGSLPVAE